MPSLDRVWANSLNRRNAFRAMAGFLAGSPWLRSQQDPFRDHSRIPGLNELVTVFDFEPVAYAKVPRYNYDYTAYGTDSEFTLRRNREAFDWVELIPNRVLDISPIRTATEILGTKMDFPIMVSPSAGHTMLHPDGELATCQGAAAASNTPYIVSNNSSFPFEKIAAAAKAPLWFQLYPKLELDDNRDVLDRVQAAGARAVVVTIDQQAAQYERILHDRNLTTRPPATRRAAPKNPYRLQESRLFYTWKLLEQIRGVCKVPMLAKGILTAEDAKQCLECGLDGVYVSNHGGRSLDYSPATLEVLPEIVDAVGGKVPVIFDSGVRRGTDALKALALGARAVCLGRVPRWGLGAYGAPGVQRILEILQAELVRGMAYTGRPTLASIDRTIVRTDFP
ncbi:MAG TPA: alpha-hydroxy-acid oxidizing protein [Candidatus Acidoferrales bacterium]|nr:alpha-hydroxy-acid oxidizing protein [Candidatus Acidoferrales bacterium]